MRNALFLLLFACGGAQHPDHEEQHHGDMSPAVKDFHETLAPLWHAPEGPDRVAKTCASAATLQSKAKATNDAGLVSATDALAAECAKDGRPDFQAKFSAVHESFHKLAEK